LEGKHDLWRLGTGYMYYIFYFATSLNIIVEDNCEFDMFIPLHVLYGSLNPALPSDGYEDSLNLSRNVAHHIFNMLIAHDGQMEDEDEPEPGVAVVSPIPSLGDDTTPVEEKAEKQRRREAKYLAKKLQEEEAAKAAPGVCTGSIGIYIVRPVIELPRVRAFARDDHVIISKHVDK
ncbi:hypothetical protein ACJX0J_012400, partial [Zea mays]